MYREIQNCVVGSAVHIMAYGTRHTHAHTHSGNVFTKKQLLNPNTAIQLHTQQDADKWTI